MIHREAERYVKVLWKDVRAGDLVHLSNNELIPADVLLLRSSDQHGLCYIDTCNLDGETNLKQRQVVRGFADKHDTFEVNRFISVIDVDAPTTKIYRFHGNVVHPSGERVPVGTDNLLLRECVLKNTDFVEGIVVYAGHETKAMLNNGGPRYKRSQLERYMNVDVVWCVVILVVLCIIGAIGNKMWVSGYTPDAPFIPVYPDQPSYEAVLMFWTYVIILQVMIPLSLYVTIEMAKLIQVYHIHRDPTLHDKERGKKVECRALNITEELGQIQYIFSDKTGTLTENKMIFRRCTIDGTDYNHPPSAIENVQDEVTALERLGRLSMEGSFPKRLNLHEQRIQEFFVLLALCNTVVCAKHLHFDQMNASGVIESPSVINIEGGQKVERRKAGPATAAVVPGSDKYARLSESRSITPSPPLGKTTTLRPRLLDLNGPSSLSPICSSGESTPHGTPSPRPARRLTDFLRSRGPKQQAVTPTPSSITPSPGDMKPIFEAESPDELALVDAAYTYNCKLLKRTPQHITLHVPGEGLVEYEIMKVLPFDSSRKTMSVVVRHPVSRQIILYTKGADTNVLAQLAQSNDANMQHFIFCTQQHLNSYARQGLVIWVLTGDKPETAINIAYSARLFSPQMELLKISARSRDAAESAISFYLAEIEREAPRGTGPSSSRGHFPVTVDNNLPPQVTRRALVVDGKTLTYILDRRSNLQKPFLSLTQYCSSVLCCRATPLQKAYIVRVVKEQLHMRTLAIGDGANDVSMIQTADVGVGISGQEGRQAVMASDFALSRFKYLERFLLVHGHWCYDRLARMVLYFFYKNAMFVFLIFWYQLFSGFTGSVMIDQMYLMLFNLVFTSLPPIAIGVYDQDAPAELLLSKPALYKQGRLGLVYKSYSFWINMADALYQSIVIYFVSLAAYKDSDVDIWEFGTTITSACMFVQLVHVAVETKSWSAIHFLSIGASICGFYGFAFLYNALCVTCFGLPSLYWVIFQAMASPIHWLVIALTSVMALLPRFTFRGLQTCLAPNDVTRALVEHQRARRGEDFLVSWSRSTSSSSVLRAHEHARNCRKTVATSHLTAVG
ncbi:hypothetical protein B566_EDAN001755 [Ephemera danica]|nr:hypothetical protein B566_EDAN001755 [Ephemera danica]